jgi:tetratricopeptide (TPR) repeat protein
MGDYVGAEPFYRRALALAENSQRFKHPDEGKILNGLATVLARMGHFEEAELLLRREIDFVRNKEGSQSLSLAANHHYLGLYLRNAGRLDQAEIELHHALAIRESKDPHGKDFAHTLSALGKMQALRSAKIAALEFYNRSMAVLQAQDDPDEHELDQLRQRIAELDTD